MLSSVKMDTRSGKKRTSEAASLRAQVGSKRSRRAEPPSHTATTGVPTNDNTIAALHAAPPVNINNMLDNISSAIVSQLQNIVRREVSEYLSNLGIMSTQHVTADNINLPVNTTDVSNQPANVVGQPTDMSISPAVPVASSATTTPCTSTSNQNSVSIPALSLDIARSSIPQNKPSFTSASLPLHATVNQKVKEKIWSNEFIELSTVFEDDLRMNSNISLNFTETGATVVTNPRKRFITIEQWTDTFAKYASVMRIKYSESAEALAQYSATVRSIAKSNGNWYYYDTQFRKLRHSTPMPWDVIQHELYFRSLNHKPSFRGRQGFQSQNSTQNQNATPNQNSTPRKFCFKFNRGEHCGGCSFQHACSFCGGTNHAVTRCFKLRRSDQGTRGQQNDSGTQQSGSKKSDNSNTTNQKWEYDLANSSIVEKATTFASWIWWN